MSDVVRRWRSRSAGAGFHPCRSCACGAGSASASSSASGPVRAAPAAPLECGRAVQFGGDRQAGQQIVRANHCERGSAEDESAKASAASAGPVQTQRSIARRGTRYNRWHGTAWRGNRTQPTARASCSCAGSAEAVCATTGTNGVLRPPAAGRSPYRSVPAGAGPGRQCPADAPRLASACSPVERQFGRRSQSLPAAPQHIAVLLPIIDDERAGLRWPGANGLTSGSASVRGEPGSGAESETGIADLPDVRADLQFQPAAQQFNLPPSDGCEPEARSP